MKVVRLVKQRLNRLKPSRWEIGLLSKIAQSNVWKAVRSEFGYDRCPASLAPLALILVGLRRGAYCFASFGSEIGLALALRDVRVGKLPRGVRVKPGESIVKGFELGLLDLEDRVDIAVELGGGGFGSLGFGLVGFGGGLGRGIALVEVWASSDLTSGLGWVPDAERRVATMVLSTRLTGDDTQSEIWWMRKRRQKFSALGD